MPKVSRETASQSVTLEGHQIHTEDLEGGYSVCFETHTADADVADWFRGLPDDRCQVPRGAEQAQRVPVPAPVVADALVGVEDHERPPALGEMVADREPGLAGADDDRLEALGSVHDGAPARSMLPMTTPIVSWSGSVGLNSTISAPA